MHIWSDIHHEDLQQTMEAQRAARLEEWTWISSREAAGTKLYIIYYYMHDVIKNESRERNSHQDGNMWTKYMFRLDSIQLRGKVCYLE